MQRLAPCSPLLMHKVFITLVKLKPIKMWLGSGNDCWVPHGDGNYDLLGERHVWIGILQGYVVCLDRMGGD